MSEMILREARSSDLGQIIALEQACFLPEQAASPSALKERIERFGPHFLVAEKEGTIAGMINGMPTNETDLCDEMYEGTHLYDPAGEHIMIFGVDTLPAFEEIPEPHSPSIVRQNLGGVRRPGRTIFVPDSRCIVLRCFRSLQKRFL